MLKPESGGDAVADANAEAPRAGHSELLRATKPPRSAGDATTAVFEPAFMELLRQLFDERIVFNQTLGVRLADAAPAGTAQCTLAMRPALIGHPAYERLHGGVISATLDAVGGMAVLAAIAARHLDEAPAQRMRRFLKLGTIDLRVDYLRPGIGARFTASGQILRLGSRVATTRMEFAGADGTLLASGAASYIVS